jgi:hypothetical protein
VGEVI